VVDKSAWSRELIERSGMFGIVVPGVAATRWTWAVGSISGREEDKFNCYGIPAIAGPVLGLPVVEEKCLAWMECRLLPPTAAMEKYDTCLVRWSPPLRMNAPLATATGSLMMTS
jgi:flavin reductase (DIM6/NTAB) family NADH-FMN oxidoreductase RutF